ncbi:collagen alpha-1(I) chain-like [Dama dama]|uniref:collagen alpha-1(I) chain-like n=1 Tax=Dama dama TaxID=30532 RepID=UPI002A36854E|nr:collagen alpha-1(I) chain-like [Dama dama]
MARPGHLQSSSQPPPPRSSPDAGHCVGSNKAREPPPGLRISSPGLGAYENFAARRLRLLLVPFLLLLFLSRLPELSSSGRRAPGDGPGPSGQAQCEPPAAHQACAAPSPRSAPRTGARRGKVEARGGKCGDAEPGRDRSQAAARAWTRRVRGGRPSAVPHGAPSQPAAWGRRALHPQLPPAPGRANPQRTFHSSGHGEPPPPHPCLAFLGRLADARPSLARVRRLASHRGKPRPSVSGAAADPGMEGRRGEAARRTATGADLASHPRDPAWPRAPGPEGASASPGPTENLGGQPRAGGGKAERTKPLGDRDAAQACGAPAHPLSCRAPARPRGSRSAPGAGSPGPRGRLALGSRAGRVESGEGAATARWARGRRAGPATPRPPARAPASPPRSPRRPGYPDEESFSSRFLLPSPRSPVSLEAASII